MLLESRSSLLARRRLGTAAVTVLAVLGSMGSTPARAEKAESKSVPATEAASDQDAEFGFRGIYLGEYLVRTYYPVEAQKSVLSFKLYTTVRKENAAEFERLLKNRRHKVRDQVIVATRLVPLTDFNDPELVSFRRRILLRLHRLLPELAIEDAYLSDFELAVETL